MTVIRALVKHGGFSYSDVMRMPLNHRHSFLVQLQEEQEEVNRRNQAK